MNAVIKPLLQYVIYPLAVKAVSWMYAKYMTDQVDDDLEFKQEERTALAKAVKNAKTNEDRRLLSLTLSKLNRLSIDEYKRVQQTSKN